MWGLFPLSEEQRSAFEPHVVRALSNQSGRFLELDVGQLCRMDGKPSCDFAATSLTCSRTRKSLCQTPNQKSDLSMSVMIFTAESFHYYGYLASNVSAPGWSHLLIISAIMSSRCFPVVFLTLHWSVLETQMSQFPISSEISDVLIAQGSEITNVNRSAAEIIVSRGGIILFSTLYKLSRALRLSADEKRTSSFHILFKHQQSEG